MPTGYTDPILKGKITNFKEYAKLCMRAFGATIHMRDESLDCEYEPRTPSEYYLKSLKEIQNKLDGFLKMTNEEVIQYKINEINSDIEYHKSKVLECDNNYEKLMTILSDVKNWEPPTEEHTGIKKFMEEQITETLKYDADSKYHKLEIKRYSEKLSNLNVEDIKTYYIDKMEKDIKYYVENYESDKKRVEDSNKWVETLLNSI